MTQTENYLKRIVDKYSNADRNTVAKELYIEYQ